MDEIPETPDVDDGFENSEWKEALNSLAENFRLVVMLYYIEGFKTSEISQILDIPEEPCAADWHGDGNSWRGFCN